MTKIKIIIISVIAVIILGLFGLWRMEVNTSKQLSQENSILTNKNNTLIKENQKLSAYIEKKDQEIAQINKEYLEMIKNIPADKCGDAYPSEELLEYYRAGVIQ